MTGGGPTEDMSSDLVSVIRNSDTLGQSGMDEPAKPAPVPTPDKDLSMVLRTSRDLNFYSLLL